MNVILGMGNVGRTLARVLPNVRGLSFSEHIEAELQRVPKGALVFVCWPDRVVLSRSKLLDRFALRYVSVSATLVKKRVATFHPLYGFGTGGLRSLQGAPIGVAGSTKVSASALMRLARGFGAKPFALPRDRTLYHAAAVLGGAGVIAAWQAGLDALVAAGVPARQAPIVLGPIAAQALANARDRGVRAALTGPIVRGEEAVVSAHIAALKKKAQPLAEVYVALSREMTRILQAEARNTGA